MPSLEHNYESEEEVQTVGDSDTTTSNSSLEVEVLEQTSDDDESKEQDEVRDSWEEDSILENKGEYKHGWINGSMGNEERDDSQSENSGDTMIPSESMDTGDKEYDLTTTDSEESVM